MHKKSIMILALFTIAAQVFAEDTLPLPIKTEDITPPKIEHDPTAESIAPGKSTTLTSRIMDADSGVQSVNLYFRPKGAAQYQRVSMELKDDKGTYTAEIPERFVTEPGIEYYIEAIDNAGNKILRGVNFSPLLLVVSPTAETTGTTNADAAAQAGGTGPTPQEAFETATLQGHLKKNWMYYAGGVVATGIMYNQCILVRSKSECETTDKTGTVTVKAPAP